MKTIDSAALKTLSLPENNSKIDPLLPSLAAQYYLAVAAGEQNSLLAIFSTMPVEKVGLAKQQAKSTLLAQCLQKGKVPSAQSLAKMLKDEGEAQFNSKELSLIANLALQTFIRVDWSESRVQTARSLLLLIKQKPLLFGDLSKLWSVLQQCLANPRATKKQNMVLVYQLEITLKLQQKPIQVIVEGVLEQEDCLLAVGQLRALLQQNSRMVQWQEYKVIDYLLTTLRTAHEVEVRYTAVQLLQVCLRIVKELSLGLSLDHTIRSLTNSVISGYTIPVKNVNLLLQDILQRALDLVTPEGQAAAVKDILQRAQTFPQNKKKIFVLTAVQKYCTLTQILEFRPGFIAWLMECCGEYKVTNAGVLLQVLLKRLPGQTCEEWLAGWTTPYLQLLAGADSALIRAFLDVINPVLLRARLDCAPHLIKLLRPLCAANSNYALSLVSLLTNCREDNKLKATPQGFHNESVGLVLTPDQLEALILSPEKEVGVRTLKLVISSPKSTEQLQQFQFGAIVQCVRWQLLTSYSGVRRDLINLLKKAFQKLRQCYDHELSRKKGKTKPGFAHLVETVKALTEFCYLNLYHSCPLDAGSPCLELLLAIHHFFGHRPFQLRKSKVVPGVDLLKSEGAFGPARMAVLCQTLQSDFESLRSMSAQVLVYFQPQPKPLWEAGLKLSLSPVIKRFEAGAHLIALAFERSSPEQQVILLQQLLNSLQVRLRLFQTHFGESSPDFQNSLCHGLVTALSFILEKGHPTVIPQLQPLASLLVKVLRVGVQISSENVAATVFDSDPFKQKSSFQKGVQQIFKSNSLLTSMDDQAEDSQNILVVSFYLLTKQCGTFFCTLGQLLPRTGLQLTPAVYSLLVQSLYESLTRLKHLGSINRIAEAAQHLLEHSRALLPDLPFTLATRLLDDVEQGKFPNVLRRSAGLPVAVSTLLRLCYQTKPQFAAQCLQRLLRLSASPARVVAVHSLNILKRVFQDTVIRNQVQSHVGQALQVSIRGFAVEDWGVRNSSLMLFSVLLTRTVLDSGKLSLSEFFTKLPRLSAFFLSEFREFLSSSSPSLYPTVYPIALVLSQLCPDQGWASDFKQTSLGEFLPLLTQCAKNHNYMGRVMIARAVLPFCSEPRTFVAELISHVRDPAFTRRHHNFTHGLLLMVFCAMKGLRGTDQPKLFSELKLVVLDASHLLDSKCDMVRLAYLKILALLFKFLGYKTAPQDQSLLSFLGKEVQRGVTECRLFVLKDDLASSLMRKVSLKLFIRTGQPSQVMYLAKAILERYLQSQQYFREANSEVLQVMLKTVRRLAQAGKQTMDASRVLIPSLAAAILNQGSQAPAFSQALLEVAAFFSLLAKNHRLQAKLADQLYSQTLKRFSMDRIDYSRCLLEVARVVLQYRTSTVVAQIHTDIVEQCSVPAAHIELRKEALYTLLTIPTLDNHKQQLALYNLMTDQIPVIRQLACEKACLLYKLPLRCPNQVAAAVLPRLNSTVLKLIWATGESAVRLKNHRQKRIFSYDKCNRYRSDFTVWRAVRTELAGRGETLAEVLSEEGKKAAEAKGLQRDQYSLECCLRAGLASPDLEPVLSK